MTTRRVGFVLLDQFCTQGHSQRTVHGTAGCVLCVWPGVGATHRMRILDSQGPNILQWVGGQARTGLGGGKCHGAGWTAFLWDGVTFISFKATYLVVRGVSPCVARAPG